MAKINSKSSISNKPKFLGYLILFSIGLVLILFGVNYIKSGYFTQNSINSDNNAINNSESNESLMYKEEHLLTFNEWKKIADIRAKEFYECTKDLDMDISRWYIYENCARTYNNNWVLFRNGLDYKANLTFEQTEELKDYWHKTRDDITEKVSKLMEENDRRKRPNKY